MVSLADNVMYSNRSRDVPSFWAAQLPAGEKIYIRLYASNSKVGKILCRNTSRKRGFELKTE